MIDAVLYRLSKVGSIEKICTANNGWKMFYQTRETLIVQNPLRATKKAGTKKSTKAKKSTQATVSSRLSTFDQQPVQRIKRPVSLQETNCPYGYGLRYGKMVIIESEARLVRRVFAVYNAGLGYNEIAELLNAEGFTTRFGNEIRANLISKICNNRELYLGHEQSRYGKYEPII